MTDILKIIARTVCKHVPPERFCDDGKNCDCWVGYAMPAAQAIQQALLDNGMVIVPREPTQHMVMAGSDAWSSDESLGMYEVIYEAMVTASVTKG